jgi:hypothetical protein
MMRPTLLSATVKGLGQLRGGEVAGLVPGLHRRGAQGDEQVALACAAGPTRHRFSRAVTHSRQAR